MHGTPIGPPSLWFKPFASQAFGQQFDSRFLGLGLWIDGGLSRYRLVLDCYAAQCLLHQLRTLG